MSMWEILDIAPTVDEKEIRRAYARQVKKYRPDSHPEEYQQLREAFEEAKQYALYAGFHDSEDDDDQSLISIDSSTVEEEVSDSPYQSELTMTYPLSNINVLETPVEIDALPVVEIPYNSEQLERIAGLLIKDEKFGMNELALLWAEVAERGSLLIHQQFHEEFSWVLSQQEGLTEAIVEHVSTFLGWRLNEYSSTHTIPFYVQNAINEQLRQTEVARAWKQCQIEAVQGDYLVAASMRLLVSEQEKVSFKVRLIPGLIPQISQQVEQLTYEYPELKDKFNPAVQSFIQQPRIAFNWRGIFLCVFWGLLLNMVAARPEVSLTVAIIAAVIIVFYLFISDIIMFWLHSKPKLFKWFLIIEFFVTLLVVLNLIIGLFLSLSTFFVALDVGPAQGARAMVFFIFIGLAWYAWPRNKPLLRMPGMALYRIFASPWIILEWLKFSWFSLTWLVVIYLVYYRVAYELLKFFTLEHQLGL
ncbi:J domain-containing protein [Providencia manganoxydans]|uniref:J domain-containing protein n=1 Tax=Providencia manganoxydans TaxID=2923283 RepID=UPI003AF3D229